MNRVAKNNKTSRIIDITDNKGNSEIHILFVQLLKGALKNRASTVHIEPQSTFVTVRFRTDGRLIKFKQFPKHLHGSLVHFLKEKADLDISLNRPQNGSFSTTLLKHTVFINVALTPTLSGEMVLMEINVKQDNRDLHDLGFWGDTLTSISSALANKRGLLILSGNNRSHINKTIDAIKETLQKSSLKVGQIADNQSSIAIKKLGALKSQNYDVIILSNLTSKSLLDVSIATSMSNLVIGVVPAPSPLLAFTWLLGLATDCYTLSRTFLGLSYQDAKPKLCPNCHENFDLSETQKTIISKRFPNIGMLIGEFKSSYALNQRYLQSYVIHKNGCKNCNKLGTIGYVAINQFILPKYEIKKIIIKENSIPLKTQALLDSASTITIDEDLLIKSLTGITPWQSLPA